MKNIRFDDYLAEQLKDDHLKKEFDELQEQSKQAVSVMLERDVPSS